jgi:hypothetical protein
VTDRFRHRAVDGAGTTEVPRDSRPQAGPITVLPETEATSLFTDAVRTAGGDLAPLGNDTRAIVWLSSSEPGGLLEALDRAPGV